MRSHDPGTGLFADALELLREADRMHRQFFGLALTRGGPCWEPPVDIIERDRSLIIRVALPGVEAESIEVTTDGVSLHVVGARPLDAASGDAIHRLEIPYGRFERRIELPSGRFEMASREVVTGCLVLLLHRLA